MSQCLARWLIGIPGDKDIFRYYTFQLLYVWHYSIRVIISSFYCCYYFITFILSDIFFSQLHLFNYLLSLQLYLYSSYFFTYLITFCSHCLLKKWNLLSFNGRFVEKWDIVRHKVNFIELILYWMSSQCCLQIILAEIRDWQWADELIASVA